METNENETVEIPEIPQVEEGQEDNTDWKAEALKYKGIATRFETKLKKSSSVKSEAKPEVKAEQPQDKKDFDLAEKSYLLANGINKSQIPLVWEEIGKSGKSIDEILESPYFKEKLEMEASKEAIPAGTNRSGGSAVSSPEYWIAKGQYPPNTPENRELRTKVASILAKQAANKTKFSSQPIV